MDVMKKVPVREQAPDVRNKNFDEVCLGYNKEEAMEEATRCLNCKNAKCIQGCPVSINIPAFIHQVKEGNIEEAYKVIGLSSALPAICGRVCPQESQCEGQCIRGKKGEAVSIGKLERFVADYALEHDIKPVGAEVKNGHKVAVIGSGPSGLTCAGDLAKAGYDVTVFEALHELGGVLVYGIPEFRLPKAIVQKEIDNLKAIGVDVETNMVIGKVLTIDEIFEMGNEAIFVGSGAGLPRFMNIPGESLKGVYSANEFLTRINLMKAYRDGSKTPIQHAKKVAVVGGGNVAMDAARSAKRLGADEVINTKEEGYMEKAMDITGGKGYGFVFETAGQVPTMHMAFELAANKAHVCFIGTPHENLTFTPKQWENMNRKEFKLTGSWMSYSAPFPGREWDLTAHYFATGQLKFDPGFIYKKIPMSQAQEAFQLFKTPGLVKGKILLSNEEE